MVERLYKCWECKIRKFREDELIGHRCAECRDKRARTVADDPGLAKTAWVPEGQQHWARFNGLGDDAGVKFRPRKKKLTKDEAKPKLEKLKRLPTWKDQSRS